MLTQNDFEDILKTIAMRSADAAAYRHAFGSAAEFAAARMIDLTEEIYAGDPQNPSRLVASFYGLGAALFPIEEERETAAGWQQYVQPDRQEAFPANERRILAVVDDQQKVIAAVVYGVAKTGPNLQAATQIDGVVGLTYVMIDPAYHRCGLGAYLVQTVVPEKAKAFLQPGPSVTAPQIIIGAEVNDVMQLTLADAIEDINGAGTMPYGRQNFWLHCGFKPLALNYAQIELRPGLGEFEALTLHIQGYDKTAIPSAAAAYLIRFHSRLCLNKQRGLTIDDQAILERMLADLKANGLTTPFVKIEPQQYARKDAELATAIRFALENNTDPATPMAVVLANYQRYAGSNITAIIQI